MFTKIPLVTSQTFQFVDAAPQDYTIYSFLEIGQALPLGFHVGKFVR